jgi:hypothetical protein
MMYVLHGGVNGAHVLSLNKVAAIAIHWPAMLVAEVQQGVTGVHTCRKQRAKITANRRRRE